MDTIIFTSIHDTYHLWSMRYNMMKQNVDCTLIDNVILLVSGIKQINDLLTQYVQYSNYIFQVMENITTIMNYITDNKYNVKSIIDLYNDIKQKITFHIINGIKQTHSQSSIIPQPIDSIQDDTRYTHTDIAITNLLDNSHIEQIVCTLYDVKYHMIFESFKNDTIIIKNLKLQEKIIEFKKLYSGKIFLIMCDIVSKKTFAQDKTISKIFNDVKNICTEPDFDILLIDIFIPYSYQYVSDESKKLDMFLNELRGKNEISRNIYKCADDILLKIKNIIKITVILHSAPFCRLISDFVRILDEFTNIINSREHKLIVINTLIHVKYKINDLEHVLNDLITDKKQKELELRGIYDIKDMKFVHNNEFIHLKNTYDTLITNNIQHESKRIMNTGCNINTTIYDILDTNMPNIISTLERSHHSIFYIQLILAFINKYEHHILEGHISKSTLFKKINTDKILQHIECTKRAIMNIEKSHDIKSTEIINSMQRITDITKLIICPEDDIVSLHKILFNDEQYVLKRVLKLRKLNKLFIF